ncbi:MAG: site-specific integrase [Planctomycetota bacterium]
MESLLDRLREQLLVRRLRPRTVKTYLECVGRYLEWLGRPPSPGDGDAVHRFMVHLVRDRRVGPSRQRQYLAMLRWFYERTLRWPQVTAGVSAPKQKRTLPRVLSRDEVRALLRGTTNLRHEALFRLGYGAGLRVSEAVGLRIDGIQSSRGVLFIRDAKGGKDRETLLPKSLLLHLRRVWSATRPSGPYLFPGPDPRRHLSMRTAQRAFKKAAARAGIAGRPTFHSLRHSFATHLMEDGVSTLVIARLLGHTSPRTTARYAHVSTGHVRVLSSPLDVLEAEG